MKENCGFFFNILLTNLLTELEVVFDSLKTFILIEEVPL